MDCKEGDVSEQKEKVVYRPSKDKDAEETVETNVRGRSVASQHGRYTCCGE